MESALYQHQQNFVAIYNILKEKKTALLKMVKVLLIFYGEKSPQQISWMKLNWVECVLIPAAPGRVCGAPGQRCRWPDPQGSAGHLVCLSSGPPAAGWADPPSRRLSAALPASPGTARWCARSLRLTDHSCVIHTQTCVHTQAYMSRHTFSITIGLLFNVQWKCNVSLHMLYRSSCIMQN